MPYKTRARWCVTRDKTRLVQESDPEAAFLLAPAGTLLPDAVARRYGLQEGEDALFAARAQAAADHDSGVPHGAEVQSRSTPPAHKMITPRARKRGEATPP